MRSIGLLAAVFGILVSASACSDGSGTPPSDNEAPVANFVLPSCAVNVPCTFVSTSSDDVEVTGWSWDFNGDGTADANTATAPYTYTAAGSFDVSLTVRDAQGLSHSKTAEIAVTGVNSSPVAAFTYTCTAADCTFTSTSTDAAPGTITTYAWTFGDGGTADVSNPTHSYVVTAPGSFPVTLTVTDNEGATDSETQTVSVTPPPNTPPTAGFTASCNATVCTFTSTSTDAAPGTITAYAWTFGDGGTADVMNPLHTYAITAPRTFTVTLTVTDDRGDTDLETQSITVTPTPPGVQGCTTTDTRVDCALDITTRSTVRLRLDGLSCDLRRQRVTVPPPIGDQVFLEVCTLAVGTDRGIFGGPLDEAIIFEAGTQVVIRFNQGIPDNGDPPLGTPAAQLSGAFPNWTINFEDGDNAGAEGEPDFADIVLGVTATMVP